MGQVEFVLVVSVVVAYLIFTPERLVLLRNLMFWAIGTWAAWYGYELWEKSTLARKIITSFSTGRNLSEILSLVWNEIFRVYFDWGTDRAANIRQECIRIGKGVFSWLRRLLWWAPGNIPKIGIILFRSVLTAFISVNPGTTSNEHKDPSGPFCPQAGPAPPRHPKYHAVLVTTAPVHVYGVVSDSFCKPPDLPPRIPWSSTGTHPIPSMLASLVFRRHFALCLVLKEVWESKSKTLAEKFEGQLFWDHCGDAIQGTRAAAWSLHRIVEVNAIEELGIIALDGDATDLCTKLYIQLRSDWCYRNIWWNDADFSLILAYLLVESKAAPKCAALMHRLAELREIEVTRPRAQASQGTAMACAATFVGSWVLTAVTGGVALPVTGPAMIASWGGAMASGITGDILSSGENEWRKRRKESRTKLQARFPDLRGLFS
ncbi:hypothetical protein EG329_012744 [Mollisiaceae sp. DMI_Dod_QoI]|nr:hypothetical protein EG329_012744 [Helotiales sp. DMI_Dod_QoI]